MSQTLLEMAKELISALIRVYHLPPDDVQALLRSTHATLLSLHQVETSGEPPTSQPPEGKETPADWQRSITRHTIICLECGKPFRQLSLRHLRIHDLNPRSYRAKYGIPRTQNLSARAATARRRELARQIRPWERAKVKRNPAQAATKKTRQS